MTSEELSIYHFICLDIDNHAIQTISNYFMWFPASVRGLVRTVICALNSYYVYLIKRLFPKDKSIIDRFHIVQMLNRNFNEDFPNELL